ncbi:MAG TPA: tyrosine--tRNA ligase [Elusimicrobiota bacterium]|nr:tyrosine--tRNA ligase [Elusimicrobiota bacterium]
MTDPKKALETLKRAVVELVSPEELLKKLSSGKALRVKLGVDPTSPDLHLGHTVVLQKLRAFQDLGHTAVLILGDFTARVGDPSGRDATRPTLTAEAVKANAQTYKDQAFKVLDPARTELRWNSEWLEPFVQGDGLLRAMQKATVQQLLAREDFKKRMVEGSPISLLEMLYPLLQGYDSVAVKADVELGGNDQIFNLLMGRELQKDAGQEPQVALTVPLLVGLDGQKKMSKSYGNAVGVNEPAREIFGKVMRVSDELMLSYYELLTSRDMAAVKALHPMEAKKSLAEELTARFCGAEAGKAEREFFEKTFSRRETPVDAAEVLLGKDARATFWSAYLASVGAAPSRKEAQRLLAQGAVSVNGEKVVDEIIEKFLARAGGAAAFDLKVGKHKFFRVKAG